MTSPIWTQHLHIDSFWHTFKQPHPLPPLFKTYHFLHRNHHSMHTTNPLPLHLLPQDQPDALLHHRSHSHLIHAVAVHLPPQANLSRSANQNLLPHTRPLHHISIHHTTTSPKRLTIAFLRRTIQNPCHHIHHRSQRFPSPARPIRLHNQYPLHNQYHQQNQHKSSRSHLPILIMEAGNPAKMKNWRPSNSTSELAPVGST